MSDKTSLEVESYRLDSPRSWAVAIAALVIITIAFGAPYVSVVALTQIAADMGGARSVPALAYALSSVAAGIGGLLFAKWADRKGMVWPLAIGNLMLGIGSAISGFGTDWTLYMGHTVLGLLGIGAVFSPLVTYVSKWFNRRRGLALSLVASGPQIAGAVWPLIFEASINRIGWSATFIYFGAFSLVFIPPFILLLRYQPPADTPEAQAYDRTTVSLPVSYNFTFAVMCLAIVFCCVAMAMPMGHLVAFCGDRGYSVSHGANMLALLLACAFVSRLLWGQLSDSIGGLETVLLSALCQAITLSLFLFTYDLAMLYLVSAMFGLGFGGVVPAYVLAIREIYPSNEAGWRTATLLLFSFLGMALGGWLPGYIFDLTLSYQAAWGLGVAFNTVTILMIGGIIGLRRASMTVERRELKI
ncbi:MAG: MFS transporter [Afipia sp.]|nr:MFS transporter [Afipia sp.]